MIVEHLQLVGDSASVGKKIVKVYKDGTDSSGTKGFHNLQAGGGSGDMTKAVYDPNNKAGDAFDYANFLGTLFKLKINQEQHQSMSSEIKITIRA